MDESLIHQAGRWLWVKTQTMPKALPGPSELPPTPRAAKGPSAPPLITFQSAERPLDLFASKSCGAQSTSKLISQAHSGIQDATGELQGLGQLPRWKRNRRSERARKAAETARGAGRRMKEALQTMAASDEYESSLRDTFAGATSDAQSLSEDLLLGEASGLIKAQAKLGTTAGALLCASDRIEHATAIERAARKSLQRASDGLSHCASNVAMVASKKERERHRLTLLLPVAKKLGQAEVELLNALAISKSRFPLFLELFDTLENAQDQVAAARAKVEAGEASVGLSTRLRDCANRVALRASQIPTDPDPTSTPPRSVEGESRREPGSVKFEDWKEAAERVAFRGERGVDLALVAAFGGLAPQMHERAFAVMLRTALCENFLACAALSPAHVDSESFETVLLHTKRGVGSKKHGPVATVAAFARLRPSEQRSALELVLKTHRELFQACSQVQTQ